MLRATSVIAALRAVKAGMGIAPLPCFMTADEPLLRRVGKVIAQTDVFVVFTPDHRTTARIRIVADALISLFEEQKELLEGG